MTLLRVGADGSKLRKLELRAFGDIGVYYVRGAALGGLMLGTE